MRTYLIVGAVFALACIGFGIYFIMIGDLSLFAICLLAAVLCFWPSYRKYREIKKAERENKSEKDGGERDEK